MPFHVFINENEMQSPNCNFKLGIECVVVSAKTKNEFEMNDIRKNDENNMC